MDARDLSTRITKSEEAEKKLIASIKIYNAIIVWYEDIRVAENLRRAIEEMQRKEALFNVYNDEDDEFGY